MPSRRSLFIALTLSLAACVGPGARVSTAPARSADSDSLTILHLNDVYEITPVEGGEAGGLARVAAYRRALADSVPALLMTLGGDFLSPSALGTSRVDGERLAGRQMVAVLNAAGLDWATLGNHEFDIPERAFRARLAESRFRYVVSNVADTTGRFFPGTVPYAIVRMRTPRREWRIGLVGAVVHSNHVPWVDFGDPLAQIGAYVTKIRDSVDVVIALTHLSVAEDQRLVELVPGIDVVLGGHEHENYVLRRGRRFVPIIKSDANARTVSVVTIHMGRAGSSPRVESRLVPITRAFRSDSAVDAEVQRWLSRAFAGYRELGFSPESVVARPTEALDGRESVVRTRSGSLSAVILASMKREAPDAEVAIFNGGSIRIDDVIPPGPITEYDIIRILPFGGKLLRADVSGAMLQRVIQQGRANAGNGGYLQLSGAETTGERVMVNEAPLDPARQYRIVTTEFLLSGAETGLPYFNTKSPEIHVVRELRDVRMALIDELRARYR